MDTTNDGAGAIGASPVCFDAIHLVDAGRSRRRRIAPDPHLGVEERGRIRVLNDYRVGGDRRWSGPVPVRAPLTIGASAPGVFRFLVEDFAVDGAPTASEPVNPFRQTDAGTSEVSLWKLLLAQPRASGPADGFTAAAAEQVARQLRAVRWGLAEVVASSHGCTSARWIDRDAPANDGIVARALDHVLRATTFLFVPLPRTELGDEARWTASARHEVRGVHLETEAKFVLRIDGPGRPGAHVRGNIETILVSGDENLRRCRATTTVERHLIDDRLLGAVVVRENVEYAFANGMTSEGIFECDIEAG